MIGDILPEILAECGIDRTLPDVSSQTFEMRQIVALMNAAGRDINARAEWAKATAEVTGTSVSTIVLPTDFQEMAESGAVILGGYQHSPVRPVVSPEMWQMLQKFPSAQPYFHLREGAIHFIPAIGVNGVTVRYVSKNWLIGKSAVTDNADETVFPESLLSRSTIWRWKRQKGLPYDDILAEFESDLETAIRADRGVA